MKDLPRLGADALATLFLVALLPAIAAPGFTDLTIGRTAALHFGGLTVLTLWLIAFARGRARHVRGIAPLALFAFGIAATGLSSAWARNENDVIPAFAIALSGLGPALSLLAPTARSISLRAITRALAVGLVGAATIAQLHQSGSSPYTPPAPYPDTHSLLFADAAAYAAIALPITLATALRYDGVDRALAIVMSLLACTLIGASHDPLLMTACGLGFALTQGLVLLARQNALLARTSVAALFAAIAIGATAGLTAPPERVEETTEVITAQEAQLIASASVAQVMQLAERIPTGVARQIPRPPTSLASRSWLIQSGLDAFFAKPLQGHGAGQTPHALHTYAARGHSYLQARYGELPSYDHIPSTPIAIAAELGLLGLVPFLLIVLLGVVRASQAFRALEPTRDLDLGNLWGAVAAAAIALGVACIDGLALKPSAMLLAILAASAVIAVAHTALGDRKGLRAWQTDTEDTISGRHLAVAALPFAAALYAASLFIPQLIGNYHRQWGNLFLLQPDPAIRAKASEQYAIALESRADDPVIHDILAQMASSRADFDAAASHIETALASNPDHVGRLLEYARIQRIQRRFEPARNIYRHALELNPRRLDSYIGYASLHATNGEYDRAIHVLRTALDLDLPPELAAEMHAQMSRVYRLDSQWENAIRHFDLAASLAQDSEYAINLGPLREQLERQMILDAKAKSGEGGHDDGHGHGGGAPTTQPPGLPAPAPEVGP